MFGKSFAKAESTKTSGAIVMAGTAIEGWKVVVEGVAVGGVFVEGPMAPGQGLEHWCPWSNF